MSAGATGLGRRVAAWFLAPARPHGGAPERGVPAAGAVPVDALAPDRVAAPRRRPRGRREPGGRRADATASGAPGAVAVLGPAGAGAFAAELALAVARRRRAPAVVLCRHGAPAPASLPLPPAPAARRLHERLAAHGFEAEVHGRLVVLALPEDQTAAAAAAARIAVVAGDLPTVVALAAPREAPLERLLADRELCVVAARPGADRALTALALAGLREAPGPAVVRAVEVPARSLGLAGVRARRGGPVAEALRAER